MAEDVAEATESIPKEAELVGLDGLLGQVDSTKMLAESFEPEEREGHNAKGAHPRSFFGFTFAPLAINRSAVSLWPILEGNQRIKTTIHTCPWNLLLGATKHGFTVSRYCQRAYTIHIGPRTVHHLCCLQGALEGDRHRTITVVHDADCRGFRWRSR